MSATSCFFGSFCKVQDKWSPQTDQEPTNLNAAGQLAGSQFVTGQLTWFFFSEKLLVRLILLENLN